MDVRVNHLVHRFARVAAIPIIVATALGCGSSSGLEGAVVDLETPPSISAVSADPLTQETNLAQGVPIAPAAGQPVPQAAAALSQPSSAESVWLADLTWQEVASRIGAGYTTVIVPTGGTEQNGPHLALDKHNVVVAHTAEQIARQAGATLVAPVMAYVPEGDPALSDGHLRWAGTISVPPPVYRQVLEATAESLAGHGFNLIVFVGDSGSSQATQQAVADDLSGRWAQAGIAVVNLDAYYQPAGQRDIMYAAGVSDTQIGSHAGAIDTSEVLALRPDLVRTDRAGPGKTPGTLDDLGVDGDASVASAELGRQLLDLKILAGADQLTSVRNSS